MRRYVIAHVPGRFLDLGTENPRGGLEARRSCLRRPCHSAAVIEGRPPRRGSAVLWLRRTM